MQGRELDLLPIAIPPEAKLMRNNAFIATQLDDELVCMNEETGAYFGLNATGKMIWDMLQMPLNLAQIIEKLRSVFEEEITIANDVSVFLLQLAQLDVITMADY